MVDSGRRPPLLSARRRGRSRPRPSSCSSARRSRARDSAARARAAPGCSTRRASRRRSSWCCRPAERRRCGDRCRTRARATPLQCPPARRPRAHGRDTARGDRAAWARRAPRRSVRRLYRAARSGVVRWRLGRSPGDDSAVDSNGARRHSGLVSSICTVPSWRSMKPPSQ